MHQEGDQLKNQNEVTAPEILTVWWELQNQRWSLRKLRRSAGLQQKDQLKRRFQVHGYHLQLEAEYEEVDEAKQ